MNYFTDSPLINALDLASPPPPSSPFIKIFNNFLPASLCDKLIDFFQKNGSHHIKNKTIGDKMRERELMKKNISKEIVSKRISWGLLIDDLVERKPNNMEYKQIYDIIYKVFDSGIKKYLRETPHKLSIKRFVDDKYFITKYDKGMGYYDWHCDRGVGSHTTSQRFISAILYLNDVSEGGETEFFGREKLKVTPEKGKLLIFPSGWTFIHRGVMPLSGDKYICNNFFRLY